MKLKFGIWHPTKTWHIVQIVKNNQYNLENYYSVCSSNLWISYGTTFIYPNVLKNCEADEDFNFDHICKKCIKVVDIEDVKTYIIYHKLGIKQ